MKCNFAICIPTYNAGLKWQELLDSIEMQTVKPSKKIIIDSASKDATVKKAIDYGFEVINITPAEFDHGQARQTMAERAADAELLIYLTQDAVLADKNSLENIIKVFDDSSVGLAYGRQLPNQNARVLEAHARLFNYPELSQVRDLSSIDKYGFKTIFCSNSFAAYRNSALEKVGGFPEKYIMGEDTIVAAAIIKQNYKIVYAADAMVYHSHTYTFSQEFKRYFDTGVFHAQNIYLYDTFGKPTGEGLKYVVSELKYAAKRNIFDATMVVPRTVLKFAGFKLGLKYKKLPLRWVKALSMHRRFWEKIK